MTVARNYHRCPPWTESEETLLARELARARSSGRKVYSVYRDVARRLRRSFSAVANRAWVLGLGGRSAGRGACAHCGREAHLQSRRLCRPCWLDPELRAAYGTATRRADDLPAVTGHDPDGPTDAEPGSEAKIVILQRRLWAGHRLWHPGDVGGGLGR
jgi:hypothetical protein